MNTPFLRIGDELGGHPFTTSFDFSKKLKKNGCNLESKNFYTKTPKEVFYPMSVLVDGKVVSNGECIAYAYDILYDICIKYPKEFFGDGLCSRLNGDVDYAYIVMPRAILKMLQEDYSQKEIEEFIWDNCLFNNKNVGKK